ncbi:TOBE domain-containing protein [Arsenophonus sp. aPb]|uniref:TOBE domain-containing protein n=1 Tax=Arsenophonus sp. aPb TaxID=3041619 RepID=UPI002468E2F3|nr:TOBE domain-containing protein [Arsenophonus sp. aPb]WGL99229.1 TOBE domain-containing protein [Arsenophonus sp. aPb]
MDIFLTLKLHDRLFADARRIKLLNYIKSSGSIKQAAQLAGMSYKSAWHAINEMNQITDKTLLASATGGKGGGGTALTPYGERLLQLYGLLKQIQQKAFHVLNEEDLPLDSLLAAISRFSLQTSARNQFFGTLIEYDSHSIQQTVKIQLTNSNTIINASLTKQSIKRLQLTAGKEVLILIKAPAIKLLPPQTVTAAADNSVTGAVVDIEKDDRDSELKVKLKDGLLLCSIMSNQAIAEQKIKIGSMVTAVFAANQIIVATLQ